jgi:ABC-type dipeptide/oligopeptide/nickel transport system ATPase component
MKIRRVIGIVGKAGSGKSTLANTLSKKFDRVFLIDSDEDFDGFVCYNFKQVKNFFDIKGYSQEVKFRISCRFEDEEEINKIFEFAWSMEKCLLVADEFSYYIEHQNLHFQKLMFQGRHREISMIVIGQRFVQFPAELRSTFTTLISFQQTETLDLQRAENYGFNPDELQNLPLFQYKLKGENIT